MYEKFTVEIITPDRTMLKSESEEITIPSFEGQMGILRDHIPFITFLRPGLIITKSSNAESNSFFIEDGIVEFFNNNLLILSANIKKRDELDQSFINDKIKNSEVRLNEEDIDDKVRYFLSHKIAVLKELNQ